MGSSDVGVTYNAVTLPRCQQESLGYSVLCNDRLLLSAKTNVQASTVYGYAPSFSCVGTLAECLAVVGSVTATGAVLVINGSSHSGMFLKSVGPFEHQAMSSYYTFKINFVEKSA